MPILYFYLYNIFALYVVFVRLIHRAAPSHRIASIVRSATMHVFFMSLFQIRDIASRSPLAPNRFNRSIFGILCLSFKFAISRRAVISPNRFNRSICNNARFLCLSFKFAIARRAAHSHRIASIVRSSVSMYGFLCRLRQCNWVKIQLRVRMG